jgi:hypothetical protein
MAQYGEYLNTYNPQKEEIYTLIDNYFDHPVMTKAGDNGNFSIYMVKIHSLLALENRFLIATVPQDRFPQGFKIPLKELSWESFHATKLDHSEKGYIPHRYIPKRSGEFQRRITLYNRDNNSSYYDVDFLPIIVTIQHGKKSAFAYNKEGTITLALETFSTIISFK